jgi:hypothetical protein
MPHLPLLLFISPWPPFPSSPSVSLSLMCTLPVQELKPPWPPPRVTVPCLPQPRRRAEKLCSAALFFPVQGIDLNRPESPPIHQISSQVPSSSAAKLLAASHPPAKPTPPVSSR